MDIPHPIFNTSEFFIQTPMISELKGKLHSWLWNGATGGLILGDYRIGKSRAVRHISDQLVNRLNQPIIVKCMTVKPRDVNTIRSVFRNLCFALEIESKARSTSDDMANQLVHFFGDMAQVNDTRQVVLMVDEFQRLSLNQLHAFAELYDNLSDLKINLTVLFIGNLEASKHLVEQILRDEHELIRGRFFTQSFNYHGIRGIEDLHECLSAYDLKNNDTVSTTEAFLPMEYSRGFRLAALSSQIWDIYDQNYRQTLNLKSWGMHYFTAMVKALITDYLPAYGCDNEDDINAMIDESIKVSGLIPCLVRTV